MLSVMINHIIETLEPFLSLYIYIGFIPLNKINHYQDSRTLLFICLFKFGMFCSHYERQGRFLSY